MVYNSWGFRMWSLYYYYDGIPEKRQPTERRGFWREGGYSLSWWGSRDSRNVRQLVTLHPELENWEDECVLCLPSPFHLVENPSPWDGTTFRVGLPTSTQTRNPSTDIPKACHLGGSTFYTLSGWPPALTITFINSVACGVPVVCDGRPCRRNCSCNDIREQKRQGH